MLTKVYSASMLVYPSPNSAYVIEKCERKQNETANKHEIVKPNLQKPEGHAQIKMHTVSQKKDSLEATFARNLYC